MNRYIVSVWEEAKVQYEVLAENEEAVHAKWERGDFPQPLLDEHDGGEVVHVKDLGEVVTA